ncbi:MAG TPA: methyltransferase domain-containing protein [Candidatus Nanoarchaeia archaeon]|nr:methyltransferase domain-containing protein [Candidatus Nanoarchaeia archaeon]
MKTTGDLWSSKMDEGQSYWQEFWDSFAKGSYDNVRLLPGNREMLGKINSCIKPGSYVLDAGCGSGNLSILLAKEKKVAAVDFSDEMLRLARKKGGGFQNLRFEKQDVTNLLFDDGTFDAVASVNVIFNLDNYDAAISEFYRVLRPGGTVIISSPLKGVEMNEELMQKVISDCENSGADMGQVFSLLEHNKALFSKGGMKFLPDESSMKLLLEKHGFQVQSTERVYYGCNLLVVGKKK